MKREVFQDEGLGVSRISNWAEAAESKGACSYAGDGVH